MRILNVRFKDLNSLPGEWEIDFTDPACAQDGIFLITGPAGAGATVFDAICLALYARTPVDYGANEIMHSQSGECFAEVTFETGMSGANGMKKYRAFWGQHRAHKKPDGVLQPQRRELTDVSTGIVETKQQDVADGIKEATGLSFEQFLRSVLPAPDWFAAFLRCGPEERPQVMERITGTEIYSQLPALTQEIRNAEKIALNLIEAEAAAFKNLDPGDRKALKSQRESLVREESDAAKELERRCAEHGWLSGITSLQQELDALVDKQTDLARRREGFNSERARLARAQRALEFGSVHSSLVSFRREQEGEKRALLDCHARLPELEANVRRSEDDLQMAVSVSLDKQAEQKKLLALLHKVRELDLKQQEKDAPVADLQAAAEELAATAAAQKERLEAEHIEFEAAQVRMRDVRKFLQNNAADEKLVEQIAGIKARFDTLEELTAGRRSLGEERAAAEKLKKEVQKRLDGQNILYETAKSKFTSLENSVKKQNGALGETLGSRSIGDWRENLANLTERKAKLAQIEETLRRRAEICVLRQEAEDKKNSLETSAGECLKKTALRQEKVQALEKELQYLGVQAELILRIKELEEARGRLTEGQPCPLCGAQSHPYTAGAESMPQDDDIQLAIRRVNDDLKNEKDALSLLGAENERLAGETLRTETDASRFQRQVHDVDLSLTEDLSALQMSLPMDADPLTGIGRERQRSEEQLQKTRLVVEKVEKGEEILRSTIDELELARRDRDQLAASRQEAEFEKETAGREFDRVARDIRLADDELKNTRLDLTRQVIPFGFKNLPEERPEQVLDELSARLARWQEHNGIRLELEKQLSAWERDLHHERAVLNNFNLELKDKNEAVKKLKAERNALRQQRVSLFGDKVPDKEEARQNALVEDAEKQVEAKRESRAAALQELAKIRAVIDDLVKSIHIRADSLQKTEMAFKKQLIASDFSNEDSYLSACLPEAERKVLQERASALDMEEVELDALQLDRKFTLDELRRQHMTDLTLEEADEKKTQAAAALKGLRQSMESLSVRLEDGEGLSRKEAELTERLEKQRAEYQRWEDFLALTGPESWRKDRNFTQELFFEILIRSANRQLQKMAGRYFLVKDENGNLSLSADSGDESRSVKNLPGGECFIVSLALTLGLSQMAGRKVETSPLFLKDWFDTLDGNSIETALSVLAGLKSGGRIGIVSHADALKERIAAQVEVIPQGTAPYARI